MILQLGLGYQWNTAINPLSPVGWPNAVYFYYSGSTQCCRFRDSTQGQCLLWGKSSCHYFVHAEVSIVKEMLKMSLLLEITACLHASKLVCISWSAIPKIKCVYLDQENSKLGGTPCKIFCRSGLRIFLQIFAKFYNEREDIKLGIFCTNFLGEDSPDPLHVVCGFRARASQSPWNFPFSLGSSVLAE